MQPDAKDLSRLRLEQAEQCLVSSKALLDIDDLRGAINRAYYAVFQAMRAVLALERKDFAKHAGVIAYFRKDYIKTGIFPVEMSDTITELFNGRSEGDYDICFTLNKDEVKTALEKAEQFVKMINKYLSSC